MKLKSRIEQMLSNCMSSNENYISVEDKQAILSIYIIRQSGIVSQNQRKKISKGFTIRAYSFSIFTTRSDCVSTKRMWFFISSWWLGFRSDI